MREVRANSLKGFASPSTKRVGLELSTHKRKSRQPQSVQHISLFWGDSYYPPVGGGRGLGGSASEGTRVMNLIINDVNMIISHRMWHLIIKSK